MRFEDALDLGGRDVLARSDDDVFDPSDDGEPAVSVDGGEIAGAEPAAADRGAPYALASA